MTVTIRDLAKITGVSVSSVSKALNNRSDVSVPLKHKIEKIALSKGYSPYIKARQTGMYAHPSRNIGIILPLFTNEYLVREVQKGIDSTLAGTEYTQIRYNMHDILQITNEAYKGRFLEKVMRDESLAGLLTAFFQIDDVTTARFQKKGIQVVQLNHVSSYGKCVIIDDVNAAFQSVRALVRLGRKKIGLISPEEEIESVWKDRLEGYKKALSSSRIRYNPYLIVHEHSFSIEESALATKTLLEREPRIDAIVYGSDVQAYGGLEALIELNKKVPDNIAVIGFDNLPFSRVTHPQLSSVSQPMFEMGRKASQMLLDAIKRKDFSNKTVKLKCRLVLRQSSHKNIPREHFT
ncbi:MAG: LacI family DNA-binding transcriptional regulator [Elusimicrobiota bacterium]